MGMNEGNMDVQQITNHACTNNYGGHPDWACNKWGDPEVKSHSNEFGPGSQYTINSRKPFTFSQVFDVNNGDFTFTTKMTQEGREISKRMGPGNEQLNAMWRVLEGGMAFVTGYWFAQDMNWMDWELCGSGPEHCNMNPADISNWRITSNGSPVPSPSPSPVQHPILSPLLLQQDQASAVGEAHATVAVSQVIGAMRQKAIAHSAVVLGVRGDDRSGALERVWCQFTAVRVSPSTT